jgi:F-type H+-transporting ATPase subunit b
MDLHQILLSATEAVSNAAETKESGGVLGTLGINWKLFLAQLVNFSIVLFVFWKWIVKPLGKTLSDRQEKIESGLKNADYMKEERENFEKWKQGEMKNVRTQAEGVLKTATDTASKTKQDMLADAQKQADKIVEQAKAQIESDKTRMMQEAKQELATLVVSASEKILRQKLDPKKDQSLIEEAVKHAK